LNYIIKTLLGYITLGIKRYLTFWQNSLLFSLEAREKPNTKRFIDSEIDNGFILVETFLAPIALVWSVYDYKCN